MTASGCSFGDTHMGITAENVAEKFHLSREEQDAFRPGKPAQGGAGHQIRTLQG